MSMKMTLAVGYLTTTLLGSVCPLQMAAAMPVDSMPMQHEEMDMTPMTPPMSPVALMSVAPASSHSSHSMPIFPSGNCTTGHCIMMDHSGQQTVAMNTSVFQLIGGTGVLPATLPLVLQPIDSLPAPPSERGNNSLAQTVSTIVLRV